MKRNHLFASAAIGAVLVVTLPVHAQILGGGTRGGVSGMQAATLGGGAGSMGRSASGRTDMSASGRAGGRVDGVGRLDRTAKVGAQEAARDAGRAGVDAAAVGRQSVGAGEIAASKARDAARGTIRAADGSTAAGVAAAGQGEAQLRSATTGAAAGGLSTTEASATKAQAGNPQTGEPAKPDRAGVQPHASAMHDRGSSAQEPRSAGGTKSGETARSTGRHDEIDADASAAVNASAH